MNVLEVRALEKRFGRVHAVRGVSFAVEQGQVFGLLGPNGSGKTTTMACALGLLAPDAGEARVLGVPSAKIHETRGRGAALFDAATLVAGLTVRQNLEYAERLLGHRGGRGVDAALELVGLGKLSNRRSGALSLGQSRRLSIARVLLGKPELLVLDEPLSGLDTVGVLDVLALFPRLSAEGITIVVSSHRMHEMERVVSHVAVILDGELVRHAPLPVFLAGDVRHLRIEAAPLELVLEVLRRTGWGAGEVVHRPASSSNGAFAEVRVELGDKRVADLNRTLVEAGVEVSSLVQERATLHDVFESILLERGAKGGAA
jgi:ABC-2 type transport system ATP-binding protein